jgi:ubiquinone biosynthesis protein Coq4
MWRPGLLAQAIRCFRAGRLGDAAAYKSAALVAEAPPDLDARLMQLETPLPRIVLAELRNLPAGSFGHAYARFMDEHRLTPLTISAPVAEELGRHHRLAVRYLLLHDAFHVLLGFDTRLPGELGVWSFVAAQGYSPTYRRAAAAARWLYALMAPTEWRALRAARRRGLALAREAECLIAQPIERHWRDGLDEVRRQLGLRSADA